MVHGVALEGLGLAEVAVKVEEGQVVLVEVSYGHGKVIVTKKRIYKKKIISLFKKFLCWLHYASILFELT